MEKTISPALERTSDIAKGIPIADPVAETLGIPTTIPPIVAAATTNVTIDPAPTLDSTQHTEDPGVPEAEIDVAACGYPTRPGTNTPPPPDGHKSMMHLLCPQTAPDWDSSDFEPTPPRRNQVPAIVPVETRGRKKGKTLTLCTKAPPEPVVPRDDGCDPISIGKLVWILHPAFPLLAVAQGKAGVAWRTKSNKLGAQCSEGHQWIQVQRIFKHDVPLMFPEPEVGCSIVESALPPMQGRHKSIMWSSRHLVSFKP